jgi:hypothetical protein
MWAQEQRMRANVEKGEAARTKFSDSRGPVRGRQIGDVIAAGE